MNLEMFAMWVTVGVMAGWLAGSVLKTGGYGPKGDLILGLVGSILGSWLFWATEISPGAGSFVLVVVAFIGAAIAIGAQRQFWCAHT
jgi:uncharacterized membrane protein YeaQ/YmgE (transglycosylase-associated protein family)